MGFKSGWVVFTENGNGIENPEKIFCRDRDRDGFLSSERRSGSGWKNPVPPDSTDSVWLISSPWETVFLSMPWHVLSIRENIQNDNFFFWWKNSSWKSLRYSYLQVNSSLLSMAVIVVTPACANIFPRWLGLSEKTWQLLFDGSNVIVRQFGSAKQVIWQDPKSDTETLVEDEQAEATHWYLASSILYNSNVRVSCEVDGAITMNRNKRPLYTIMLSDYWDLRKIFSFERAMKIISRMREMFAKYFLVLSSVMYDWV
jgi:hypothetical protein